MCPHRRPAVSGGAENPASVAVLALLALLALLLVAGPAQVLQGHGRSRQDGAGGSPQPVQEQLKMAMDEPVGVHAPRTGRGPAELGCGDHQIADAHVAAELTGRLRPVHDLGDQALDPSAGRLQVGVVLVERAGHPGR